MRKRLMIFAGGGGMLLLFVLFSYLVHKDIFTALDFDTTVRLQDNLPRRVDSIFSLFSLVGNFEVTLAFLLVLLVILRKIKGIMAFFSFGMFHVVELFGKSFVDHPPPPHFLLRTDHPVDFPQFYVSTEFSYPSGHSGRAMFLTLFMGFFILRSTKLSILQKAILLGILATYDVIMFVSRVYLGEHWLTDVIGGILLGAAFSLFALAFL